MRMMWCWRCKAEVQMLEPAESQYVFQKDGMLGSLIEGKPVDVREAKLSWYRQALQRYEEITGRQETDFNVIWHHVASRLGEPCETCGLPLRSPSARYCAECGYGK